ncbi:hypothetical protein BGZ65_007035 [Modicella reniformis]|uniref:Uncharacterized protein n=1 Tax=Modicella reniformis TaxID=1440133 RepID=A0A9P6M1N9_9FUNG|nr:hypothetical protein BGZ65_007035 [Modicella reniformis]
MPDDLGSEKDLTVDQASPRRNSEFDQSMDMAEQPSEDERLKDLLSLLKLEDDEEDELEIGGNGQSTKKDLLKLLQKYFEISRYLE